MRREADPGFDARFQDPNGCELGLYSCADAVLAFVTPNA